MHCSFSLLILMLLFVLGCSWPLVCWLVIITFFYTGGADDDCGLRGE